MLARVPTRRLVLSSGRAISNYPKWQLNHDVFTDGVWEVHNGQKIWVPNNKKPERIDKAEWDTSKSYISLTNQGKVNLGMNAGHYEAFFGLTVSLYILFSLYDYRAEAKQ